MLEQERRASLQLHRVSSQLDHCVKAVADAMHGRYAFMQNLPHLCNPFAKSVLKVDLS